MKKLILTIGIGLLSLIGYSQVKAPIDTISIPVYYYDTIQTQVVYTHGWDSPEPFIWYVKAVYVNDRFLKYITISNDEIPKDWEIHGELIKRIRYE